MPIKLYIGRSTEILYRKYKQQPERMGSLICTQNQVRKNGLGDKQRHQM